MASAAPVNGDGPAATEWARYGLDKLRPITGVPVYWFDDTVAGQCRGSASWRLLDREGTAWKPVAATGLGVKKDAGKEVKFKALETTGLRLEVMAGVFFRWSPGMESMGMK